MEWRVQIESITRPPLWREPLQPILPTRRVPGQRASPYRLSRVSMLFPRFDFLTGRAIEHPEFGKDSEMRNGADKPHRLATLRAFWGVGFVHGCSLDIAFSLNDDRAAHRSASQLDR